MSGSIMLIILVVAMLGFMVLGSRKQKKMMEQRYDMLTKLLPGDEVATTAGLYGTVVKVSDTKIDLMIADGIVTTWDLNAVRGKVEDTPSELEEEMEAAATSDTPEEDTALQIPDTIEGIENLGTTNPDSPQEPSAGNSDK